MEALIIGYGHAGQRHGQLLDKRNIDWCFVEPNQKAWSKKGKSGRIERGGFTSLESALDSDSHYDYVIIATPPDLHLEQIRQCLDAGLTVLCEKPLCGLGQLDQAKELLNHPQAEKVMVAYNWRYHPQIQELKRIPMYFTCWQERVLPEWGLLLDHCSHDLDILRQLCGEVEIISARHYPQGSLDYDEQREMWVIVAQAGEVEILLREMVGPVDHRSALLEFWEGDTIQLDPDPAMFEKMYAYFLDGVYWPNLEEAIKTQELLEKCEELNVLSTVETRGAG